MATNETLWLMRQLAHTLPSPVRLDFRVGSQDPVVDVREDALLRRRDKHPNSTGALLLGLGEAQGIDDMAQAAERGELDLALVLHYPPVVGPDDPVLLAALERLVRATPVTIAITNAAGGWWETAQVLLPLASWAEEEGTYTNFAGAVQHLARAVPPPGHARPAWQVLRDLLPQTAVERQYASVEEVFDRGVSTRVPFQGLRYDMLLSRQATAYPPEGRMAYGQEGFAGR
jgi:predicted molibdopterin-dependent oxidoreductase YjgC